MSAKENQNQQNIEKAATAIAEADALLINAGAGMGVDSGLPDFRGNEGFWKAYPPFARLGYSFIDMANPQWFHRDPHLAWGFYGHRLNLYRKTVPHEGFRILLDWGKRKKGGYFVFTSNVDGQFQRAGYDDSRIEECHGSIHHMQCSAPCRETIWDGAALEVKVNETTMKAADPLPTCPYCGTTARPNILMFGDWNWLSQRVDQQQHHFNEWLEQNRGGKIAVVECGAGTGVPTVRHTSEHMAARFNATLIRINVREPQVPAGHLGFPMGAAELLTRIKGLMD